MFLAEKTKKRKNGRVKTSESVFVGRNAGFGLTALGKIARISASPNGTGSKAAAMYREAMRG